METMEEMKGRIVYDAKELIQVIEKKLDKLGVFRFDSRYSALLGEKLIQRLSDWDRAIRSRRDDPFTLVVCGEFKRGKSSLINALLGEDIVTTNVTTETVTLNRLSYGPHSNEAVLTGGRRLRLSDEELKRSRLEELMQQSDEPIRQLELKRPVELLKKVTIIDTPGLGDSLKDFSGLVSDALRQADAVIYVFNVSYPLSQTEQFFLKTEILPQRYTDIFLIGNYADIIRNETDYNRILEMLMQKLQDLLPGMKPWMLSALDERCLQVGKPRPNTDMEALLGGEFTRFREELNRRIEERREFVLPDRMQRMLRSMTEELSEMLSVMEAGLTMDSSEIKNAEELINEQLGQQAQTEVEQKIFEKVESMKARANQKLGELLDRMRAEVDTLSDMKPEELLKYYSFYCIDTLQEAMNQCAETDTMELYEMLDGISAELTQGFAHVERNAYSFRFALDNRTWTKGDNISYVVHKVGGNVLGLISDGFAGAMRNKEMAAKTPEILQNIITQYTSLRASCLKAVDDIYGKMKESIKKQIDDYYAQKLEAAQEQAQQAAMVARQDKEKKAEIKEAIEQLRAALGEMEL